MNGGRVSKLRLAAAAALLLAWGPVQPGRAADAPPVPMPITTGGVTGIYYQIGAAICRLLRDHPPSIPIDCQTQGSAGSVGNVLAVSEGRMPLGLAQADTVYYAVTGTGGFADRSPNTRLRVLFSPVVETFIVLTTAANWVPQIADLRGRRINIGAPASGTEVTFRQMMAARGWSPADFRDLSGVRASLQAQALCGGRVDAVAFVAANPVPVIQDAAFACAGRFVPLDQAFADDMVARHPYYVPAAIPGGLYPNNPDPTPTIGVRGILVASTATPDEIAYTVTRTVFEHLAELRTLHLAFADVTAAEMLDQCMFAPVHPGAARYYREAGLPLPRSCLAP
jgi:TRAP transporter TAXI family solute receptor